MAGGGGSANPGRTGRRKAGHSTCRPTAVAGGWGGGHCRTPALNTSTDGAGPTLGLFIGAEGSAGGRLSHLGLIHHAIRPVHH